MALQDYAPDGASECSIAAIPWPQAHGNDRMVIAEQTWFSLRIPGMA
jgi:hypothetical protein